MQTNRIWGLLISFLAINPDLRGENGRMSLVRNSTEIHSKMRCENV
jgi:hypothetical protein